MKMIETEELKQLELQILEAFHSYCKKHGLRYILYAGTLIGAIRHKGFIPWDDDIDVAMPRPDYEKFIELVQAEPVAPHLKLFIHRDETSYYWVPVAKLVDNRTEGHELYQGKGVHNGAWIDIYPIDGISESEEEHKKHLKKIRREVRMLTLETIPFRFSKNPAKLCKRLLVYPIYLFGKNKNHKLRAQKIDELALCYSYEDCKFAGITSSGYGVKASKDTFEELTEVPFEHLLVNVPKNYDRYLTQLFGDYMTPPPEHLRIPLHFFECWWKEGYEPVSEE